MKITREMMIAGGERWAKVFAALEAMGESDGRRETILKLWREVYPQHDWADAKFSLFVYQQSGYVSSFSLSLQRAACGRLLHYNERPLLSGIPDPQFETSFSHGLWTAVGWIAGEAAAAGTRQYL